MYQKHRGDILAERRRRGDDNKVVSFEEASAVCAVDLCRVRCPVHNI